MGRRKDMHHLHGWGDWIWRTGLEEEAQLSFMKKNEEVYIWPENKNTSGEPTENILWTVGFPLLNNFREQVWFSEEDIEKLKNISVKSLKQHQQVQVIHSVL